MTAVPHAQGKTPAGGKELDLPELPQTRQSPEAERLHRKQQLAITFRIFARYGYDEGIAGHVTARDPQFPSRFWVNPYAVHFSRIKVSDLLLIDEDGHVIEGQRRTNKAAFWIHSSIHRARPDVTAVAHAHTIHRCAEQAPRPDHPGILRLLPRPRALRRLPGPGAGAG